MDVAGVLVAGHDDAGHDPAFGQAHVQEVVAQQGLPVAGAQRQRQKPVAAGDDPLDGPCGDEGILGSTDHGVVGVKGVLAVIEILAHLLVQVVQHQHIRHAAHRLCGLLHGCHLDSILLAGYDQDAFACTEPDPVPYNDIGSVLYCLFHQITRSNKKITSGGSSSRSGPPS